MMTATHTPLEVEKMRELVDELNKLDERSTWTGKQNNMWNGRETVSWKDEPQVDPLLIERQLLTYITNGTTPAELAVRVTKKRSEKKAEEEKKQAKDDKENWDKDEREILRKVVLLKEVVEWAADQKDVPHVNLSDYEYPSMDRYYRNRDLHFDWKMLETRVSSRLDKLDDWEHVPVAKEDS